MGFSDDEVTQRALDIYYREQGKYGDLGVYAGEGAGGLETEAPWELARADALAVFIADHADPLDVVLDVGCSTGTLLVLLQRCGFEHLSGVEPLPTAVQVARAQRALEVQGGWITDTPHDQLRDVIVFSHVLEHVLALRSAIQEARERLSDGGLLVIEVPDASRFADFVHIPYQDFNTEHINHFSGPLLSEIVTSIGFDLVEVRQEIAASGPDHPYPVIRGAWRKGPQPRAIEVSPEHRREHRTALARYCEISESMFTAIDHRTLECVGDEPFAIWGAGQFTMKWIMRNAFPKGGLRLLVDQAPSRAGLVLGDHVVVDPAAIDKDRWPALILTGSAYAAESIRLAVEDLSIDARVASPFPPPTADAMGSEA